MKPWIETKEGGTRPLDLEAVYWSKGGRTLVFVLQNIPISGRFVEEGEEPKLAEATVPVEVRLAAPVREARDERTGRKLPAGDRFSFQLKTTEAVFFSFKGSPPRR